MIRFRIQDPAQIADALGAAIRVAGAMGRDLDFSVGPFDDKELRDGLVIFVEGPDEVEASEVLGQRLIDVGIPFDDAT